MKKYCFSLLSLCALHSQGQHKIAFDSSLTGAFEKAGKANKLVFIDCQTDFCGACRRMEQEVFTLDSVADYFNEHFVNVSLNMVKDEGLEAGKKYQIKALPTFLIMDDKGKELYRFTGWWPADEYMAKVRSGVNPQSTMSRVIAAYKAGDRSKPVLREYIRYSMHAHEDSTAKAAALKYLKMLSDKEKLQPENWFLFNKEEGPRIFGLYSEQFSYLADHWRDFEKLNGKEKVEDRLRYDYTTIITRAMTGAHYSEHHISQKEFDRYREQIKGTDLSDKEQLTAMMEIAQAIDGKDTVQVSKLMVRYIPIVSAEQQRSMVYCYEYMLEKNKDYKRLPYFQQVVDAVIDSNKDEKLIKEMMKYKE